MSRGPSDGVEVELRDGSWVQIRQIRPADRDALRRGFERLSAESRYRRFLAPVEKLTESQLTYLTDVDHTSHEAVVALDMARPGELVGVGRYVRDSSAKAEAEAAVTVADDWQGRGLGMALTRILAGRAAEVGIAAFTALLLAENDAMTSLFDAVGSIVVEERSGGTLRITIPLDPEVAGDPALRSVMRAVAGDAAELARPPGVSAGR